MRPHNHGQRDLSIYTAIKMGARVRDLANAHRLTDMRIYQIRDMVKRQKEEAERPPELPPRRKPKGLYACYAKPSRR
jgi:Mor family transcriptional regulator